MLVIMTENLAAIAFAFISLAHETRKKIIWEWHQKEYVDKITGGLKTCELQKKTYS